MNKIQIGKLEYPALCKGENNNIRFSDVHRAQMLRILDFFFIRWNKGYLAGETIQEPPSASLTKHHVPVTKALQL